MQKEGWEREEKRQSLYIRLSGQQIFRFISQRALRVCAFVGAERYAFKCLSAGLRKRFTGCKTAVTSSLPVTGLNAFSFFVLFSLAHAHTLLFLAYKKLSLIGVEQSTVCLFRVTDMECHIQTLTVPSSCTHTDMQPPILSHQSEASHIRSKWTRQCMCASEHVRPTCMSSFGTSSYVLESVEVLLEDVAHLGLEEEGKWNLREV